MRCTFSRRFGILNINGLDSIIPRCNKITLLTFSPKVTSFAGHCHQFASPSQGETQSYPFFFLIILSILSLNFLFGLNVSPILNKFIKKRKNVDAEA